ncbi:F0F1 ATP synthase subunit epsilon [Leucobacter luti]|uniref:ATP synthase F1 subcomplex epsilon subunit n=1 Tax=Leucobacter luti TaxID=340320 RepID=A0A4Q7U874_9MICO|nr:F0F1 ATP synthase subunit epsilon [Leucobacter luti]MBL3700478.1 F0F1 ATP synthase subunit epsilon [Leucobacter luti]RZT68688.1 ATP synthase F1 subcomplex epsilon subunit [Leucobacter luti]
MASLNVSVVSADREVWTGVASQVVARTVEGEIGILSGHEPFLALLAQGEVRVTAADGAKVTVDAEGGFLSVDHDNVTIVAGKAVLV